MATGAMAPVVTAGLTGATYTARAAAARRRGVELQPGVPVPAPSFDLAMAVGVDALMSVPVPLLASLGSPKQYAEASAEVDEAVRSYGEAGWLEHPGGRHPAPTAPVEGRVLPGRGRLEGLEVLRFDSGWSPLPGEPGAARWGSFDANGTVRVRLLRHPGPPRPWLIAVHGQGMGRPSDVQMLRVRRLHEELGVNVALPVLPLHGRRSPGLGSERQFVSNVYLVNNVLGLTQSVWDLRRLLQWLRTDQQAPAVGVLGVSLGSYACSLLATVEADLACVVAVVPTADLAESLRHSVPVTAAKRRLHRQLHDERSQLVHRVVSPLASPCLVPHDRRHIVAGQVDRIARPGGAVQLWRHWDEPHIAWLPRGHLTTWRSPVYDQHIDAILTASSLAAVR